jgi:hypothetical protein
VENPVPGEVLGGASAGPLRLAIKTWAFAMGVRNSKVPAARAIRKTDGMSRFSLEECEKAKSTGLNITTNPIIAENRLKV